MIDFEFTLERWCDYLGRHETRYDVVSAPSVEAARARIYWIFGDLVDILSLQPIED